MIKQKTKNMDINTVNGFGDEWTRFDQTGMSAQDTESIFNEYFSIFPLSLLSKDAVGFDLGCGSGRWARMVSPKVKALHCIDPSDAIDIARYNLREFNNCEFHRASVMDIPLADGSMDFGYSIGVLHHIPDTREALAQCVKKLKIGAPFLLYLYYSFDNRPLWFRLLWSISEFVRWPVSRMPFELRYIVSQIIATLIYWPFAKIAKISEDVGINITHFPLMRYRNCGFYVMRTDALDRFGTRLEQRFSRMEIKEMMESVGLENIIFSEKLPFWCALGFVKVSK